MRKTIRLFAILGVMGVMSCGDEKKEQEKITIGDDNRLETISTERETVSDTSPAADSIQKEEGVVEVELTVNDQMEFNLQEIRVKEGQRVRLILKHAGQLPENAMGHNFVLLQQGTDLAGFAGQAAGARENDYIPPATDKVIAHTELIGGGEQTSIEFEAPPAGTYDFICSFPGHYIQMQGKFIVE